MKTTDFLKESFIEDAAEAHQDHEVQMARSDCYNAAKYAIELHKLLKNISEQEGLDGWVSEKITLANDYLRTVTEYLRYEQQAPSSDMPDFDVRSATQTLDSVLGESTRLNEGAFTWYLKAHGRLLSPSTSDTPYTFKSKEEAIAFAKEKYKTNWQNIIPTTYDVPNSLENQPDAGWDEKRLKPVAEDDYDDAVAAFLAKNKPEQGKTHKPRKSERLGGSRHIGGGGEKMKASRTGIGSMPTGKAIAGQAKLGEQGVAEGSLEEYGDTPKGQKMLTKVQKRATDRVVSKRADTDPAYAKKNQQTANAAWERMSDKDVAEGLGKSIKRGLQGWGSPQDKPSNIVKRNKGYDNDTAKKIRAELDNASPHSPADLQKRVLDRKLKDVAEGKADPVGSWVVYDGDKVKRFKTRDGAKAYAEKNGGKVASSEHYADKIQKQDVAEGTWYAGNGAIKEKISKYEELALAANRAGDDAKCKMYQQKIQTLKQKMSHMEESAGGMGAASVATSMGGGNGFANGGPGTISRPRMKKKK